VSDSIVHEGLYFKAFDFAFCRQLNHVKCDYLLIKEPACPPQRVNRQAWDESTSAKILLTKYEMSMLRDFETKLLTCQLGSVVS
jgi:hypothetical protein